jgi:RNA recognition motif-containing protein
LQEGDLEDLFSKYGKVIGIRINAKGVAPSKNLPDGTKGFGFVVFEEERSANECLQTLPIYLNNNHRLNVETKKKNVSI